VTLYGASSLAWTRVVMVPWTKTQSPFSNDSAMLSPGVLNVRTTWRVGAATHLPLRRRSLTRTVISVICVPDGGEPDLRVVGQVALEGDGGAHDAAPVSLCVRPVAPVRSSDV
jgi:hypothetical protein